MEIALVIVIWIVCGVVGAMVMASKGRTGLGGFALGVMLGPIGLIVALLDRPSEESEAEREMRVEEIKQARIEGRPAPPDTRRNSGSSLGSVLVDVLVSLLILMIGGAIFARIAGVEEGESAPAWVQFAPLVLAMLYLGWRTLRRSRQRQEEERRAADQPPEMPLEAEVSEVAPMSEFEWRSRIDSAVRNLGSDAFQRFVLEFLSAIGLSDIQVERTSFDGAVECVATSDDAGGVGVYVIFRRSFGTLGANQIRELRERMDQDQYEGLYVTNGDFTASARTEATQSDDPVRLIGGDELIDLMRTHGLGVELDYMDRVIAVDEEWFRELESEYLTREDD